MEKMYHCTKLENLKKILEKGLVSCKPKNCPDAIPGVYLSKSPFSWMYYVTEKNSIPGALIEVDVTGLDLFVDRNSSMMDDDVACDEKVMEVEDVEFCELAEKYAEEDETVRTDYVFPGCISPERFTRVSVSSAEKPMCFEDYRR